MSPAKKTPNRRALREETLLVALLDSAGIRVEKKTIATWTPAQRGEASRWAAAVALAEGPRPSFLPAPLVLINGGAESGAEPANDASESTRFKARLKLCNALGMGLSLALADPEETGRGPALDLAIWRDGEDGTAVYELTLDEAWKLGRELLDWSQGPALSPVEEGEDLDDDPERADRLELALALLRTDKTIEQIKILCAPGPLDNEAFDRVTGIGRGMYPTLLRFCRPLEPRAVEAPPKEAVKPATPAPDRDAERPPSPESADDRAFLAACLERCCPPEGELELDRRAIDAKVKILRSVGPIDHDAYDAADEIALGEPSFGAYAEDLDSALRSRREDFESFIEAAEELREWTPQGELGACLSAADVLPIVCSLEKTIASSGHA